MVIMSRERILEAIRNGDIWHGIAVCYKDVEHDFPHGRIVAGDKHPISAWLPEDDIYCIVMPNPDPPGFFMYRMDEITFVNHFNRVVENENSTHS